jgi:hypothetical protein
LTDFRLEDTAHEPIERLASRGAIRRIASFDPASLLVSFHADETFVSGAKTVADVINALPLRAVAHEFTHFIQALTTAVGLREFLFEHWLHRERIRLLQRASEEMNGQLLAPVIPRYSEYQSDGVAEAVGSTLGETIFILLCEGGLRISSEELDAGQDLLDLHRWRVQSRRDLFGSDVPVVFADMRRVISSSGGLVFGAVHLQESYAHAVELTQARLNDLPGDRTVPYDRARRLPLLGSRRLLAHPYLLANSMYSDFADVSRGQGGFPSTEEMSLIIDAALMLDPAVARVALDLRGTPAPPAREGAIADYGPSISYLQLLSAFSANRKDLPRLTPTWRQKEATEFQDALLAATGVNATMRDLTDYTLVWAEWMFEIIAADSLMPPELLDEYRALCRFLLKWRRDTLGGSAILEDLLTGEEKLRSFAAATIPAVSVGASIWSNTSFREGEGIGVDAENLRQLHAVARTLVHGDSSCHLHRAKPRECAIPPFALCSSVASPVQRESRCVREGAVKAVLRACGAEGVSW